MVLFINMGFPGGSAVKNLPAMQKTQVQSLGQEGLLEKEMATYASILVWEIPWTEEPGRLQFTVLQESDPTEQPNNKCAQPFSHVRFSVIPWTVAHQALLSMGFPRQEYWSRLPFSTPKQ